MTKKITPKKGHKGSRKGRDSHCIIRVCSCPFVGEIFLIATASLLLIGCNTAPTTQPVTEDQRQDQILNDPMNYKPDMNHDVGGGGIGESKGLGGDINEFLNP